MPPTDSGIPPSLPDAVSRVKEYLPAPTQCPHCHSAVEIVNNDKIYGQSYGLWPWTYRCVNVKGCGAYVGMHPRTHIPLGTLATAPIREARKKAKSLFNPLWQGGKMQRGQAYAWLARELNIPKESCHFGWFDVTQCEQAIQVLTTRQPK